MTIDLTRYAPGGDFYAGLSQQFGSAAAEAAYAAAKTGDVDTLNYTLSNIRSGQNQIGTPRGGTSTFDNFVTQLATDPLSAPLDGINNQIGKAVWNVVKNPFVLAIVAGAIWWKFFRKRA